MKVLLSTRFRPLRRQVDDFLIRDVVLVDDGVLVGGPRVLESRIDLDVVVIVVVVRMAVAADAN